MEVFIGNLSAETRLLELQNILGNYIMHLDFTTHEGRDCDHRKYHFVVVNAKNRDEGMALIERLNGMNLVGNALDVHEYIHRDQQKSEQWQGENRRINPVSH